MIHLPRMNSKGEDIELSSRTSGSSSGGDVAVTSGPGSTNGGGRTEKDGDESGERERNNL